MSQSLKLPHYEVGDHPAPRRELRYSTYIFDAPYIDASSINRSMRINYMRLFLKYQQHCKEFNKAVDDYNAERAAAEKKKRTITDLHNKAMKLEACKKKIKASNPDVTAWNKHVADYNQRHGTNLPLQRKQPLKDHHGKILSTLLIYYSAQITAKVSKRRRDGNSTKIGLPALRTNSWKILNHKVEGIKQHHCCPATVRNHLRELEAANILQYISHGSRDCSEIFFNPIVLNIEDNSGRKSPKKSLKTPKKKPQKNPQNGNSQTSQNQSPTGSECKTFTVQGYSLPRTSINHQERKEVVTTSDIRNGASAPTAVEPKNNRNTKNRVKPSQTPTMQNVKKIEIPAPLKKISNDGPPPRAKNDLPPPAQKRSLDLHARIQDTYTLAGDLAAHRYDAYQPLDMDSIRWELQNGSLTAAEFRAVALQEWIKEFASLYRGIDKHYTMRPWMWANAIQDFEKNLLITFTGRVFPKDQIVDRWIRFRRCLKMAAYSYRNKHASNYPRFPHEYLRRGHKISFWNLDDRLTSIDHQTARRRNNRKKWRIDEMRRLQVVGREIKSNRSKKRKLNDYDKAVTAVRRWLDPAQVRWTREYLQQYVDHELLKSVARQLPDIIAEVEREKQELR